MSVRPATRSTVVAIGLLAGWWMSTLGPAAQGGADTRAIEFPDTAERLTMVVDLHTHSVFSDGDVWPSIRMREAVLDGLDAIAVTEHLEYQPHLEDIPHPDRNRSFEVAVDALPEGSELIVIPGSEITRFQPVGHMNAVFIRDANALFRVGAPPEPYDASVYRRQADEWPAQAAVDAANEQGAFVFWNHPWTEFRDTKAAMTDFHRANVASGKLHGIEVANGTTYSAESFQLALEYDLALIGVSDVHGLIDWNHEPHAGGHRPVTLVFAEASTGPAIRQALFERRTVVWFQNRLVGRPRDLMPLLDASVTIETATYRGLSQVLTVGLTNVSDARFLFRSLSEYSELSNTDVIEVPPHAETTLRFRTGGRLDRLTLGFEVLNALTAPETHPVIAFDVVVNRPQTGR